MTPTISIVTITQYKRFDVLQILFQCITEQTIRPNEWVIVEGSSTQEEAELNKNKIKLLSSLSEIPIKYVMYEQGLKLGELRNRGNNTCQYDIIICMDDDDYYPPTRVQHVIEEFDKYPDKQIAGCSSIIIHDYISLETYICKGFHQNHSTNNAMAWKKEYVKTHSHDPTKTHAEEASFTNNFSEPMIQLLPEHTIFVSSHNVNTFDKKNILKNNPLFLSIPFKHIFTFIPEKMYRCYFNLFRNVIKK